MRKIVSVLMCLMIVLSLFSCRIKDQKGEENVSPQRYFHLINFDEHLGEIKLKDCRFPSNHLRLDECEILNKAILDMDGDGVNEYVIQLEAKDHIVIKRFVIDHYSIFDEI